MKNGIYKSILFVSMAILVVFPPIARGAVRVWSITPVLLTEYFILSLWVCRMSISSNYRFRTTPIDIPVTFFILLTVISSVFSVYRHESIYAALRIFGYIGIFYIIVNEFDHGMKRRLVYIAIAAGALISAYGILQYFNIFKHSWWSHQEFLSGTFVNHNHFAGYLELVMPVSASVLMLRTKHPISGREWFKRLFLASSLAIMGSALILTQSRGAWASLGIAFIVMVFVSFKNKFDKKRFIILLLFIALLVIPLAGIFYFGKDIIIPRVETITNASSSELSSEGRFKIWGGTVAMIKDNMLIGSGPGTFIWAFPKYRPEGLSSRANFAHNDYLNTAAEMGILAPILMIWIFSVIVKHGFNKDMPSYIIGCAAGALSLMLHGLVDFNFHIPSNMILFTIFAAFIMSGEKR